MAWLVALEERQALRQYLIDLLLPLADNKTLVERASLAPGVQRQALHHFVHDVPGMGRRSIQRRLQIWQAHPFLDPMLEASSSSTRLVIPSGATAWRGHVHVVLISGTCAAKLPTTPTPGMVILGVDNHVPTVTRVVTVA